MRLRLCCDGVRRRRHGNRRQFKLAPGGESSSDVFVPGSFIVDNVAIGYGTVCTAPDFSFVFHDEADVDGDGIPDHAVYQLTAQLIGSGGLGGVRLTWHRQVSPPPATPTFADVQVGDFGFQQIEALAASGITGGCGGGNFCPNANVTRAQMAIFLAKALGLHWPN